MNEHKMDLASKWNLTVFYSNLSTKHHEIVVQWERGEDLFQILLLPSQALELIKSLNDIVNEVEK